MTSYTTQLSYLTISRSDICCLLTLSLPPSKRRRFEHELIAYYHDRISALYPSHPFTLERLHNLYRASLHIALGYCMLSLPYILHIEWVHSDSDVIASLWYRACALMEDFLSNA